MTSPCSGLVLQYIEHVIMYPNIDQTDGISDAFVTARAEKDIESPSGN